MINFADILVVIGLFVLRIGVPVAIMAALVYSLKRLDQRWEAEARAQQAAEQPARQVAKTQPATAQPVARPARVDAPVAQMPFDPTRRTQAGLLPMGENQHCWDVKACAETNYEKCAAYQHPDQPCWQARLQAEGKIPESCPSCEIFQNYPLN
jgi:hypothetical protein